MEKNKEASGGFFGRLDARGRAHNTGLDLLRIVSMLFIVAVHAVNWSGMSDIAQPGSSQFAVINLIRAITMPCVDIFALISGFVGYTETRKPVRTTGLLKLYLQVVTYGLLVSLVFQFVRPEMVSLKDYVLSFFPITGNLYWYYTAYFGLFLLMPVLNEGLRHTPKRTLCVAFAAMVAVFSAYSAVCDRFKLDAGYTMAWVVLLYLMGGILKKCEIGKKIKPWTAFLGIAILTCITWLWKLYGLEFSVFGIEINRGILMPYTSPTILGASVLYVIGFSKIRFGKGMMRFAAFASPCVFSVYLVNGHQLVHDLLEGRFAYLASASALVIAGTIFGFSLAFVAASILIDRVRLSAFDLLRIPQMLSGIDRALHDVARKWIPDD